MQIDNKYVTICAAFRAVPGLETEPGKDPFPLLSLITIVMYGTLN